MFISKCYLKKPVSQILILSSKSLQINGVEWKTVKESDVHLPFMKLDMEPKMIAEPFEDRIKFWKSLNV